MIKKLLGLAIAVIISAMAVVSLLADRENVQLTARADGVRQAHPVVPDTPAPVVIAPSAPSASAIPPSRRPRTQTYAIQYADSTDLKLIVDAAKSNPEKGSYFYATMALRECDQLPLTVLTATVPPGSENDARRAELLRRLKQRCANITSDDIRSLRKLGGEGLEAGDVGLKAVAPIAIKESDWEPQAQRSRWQAKVDALYQSNDAGITELAFRELMVASDNLSLNDRQLTEAERSSLPAALLLASCDLGAVCDKNNYFVQYECLAHGQCEFSNVDDYVKRVNSQGWLGWTRGSRYDSLTAARLKDEIVQAIANGDRNAIKLKPNPK